MSKLDAILDVYGIKAVKKDKAVKVGDEDFFAWTIEKIPKKELLKNFTKEDIEAIYYSGI